MNIFFLLVINFLLFIENGFAHSGVDVKFYGAAGNGITNDTRAIQAAIDSCFKNGGGTVLFTDGIFLTGTIQLKSNVGLYIAGDAKIIGSKKLNDYPLHKSSHPFGPEDLLMRTLILADEAENIFIKGTGLIDGNGESPEFSLNQNPRPVRPMVIRMISCNNVAIEDIKMIDSPMWMQQYVNCEELKIKGITVLNHVNRNNDGLDIVGCRNVIISGCHISSDDDALCFKTLSNAPNNNIVVSDCILASNCNALKIGTETSADHHNYTVSNCIIKKTGYFSKFYHRDTGLSGLAIESVDGANIENIIVQGLIIDGVNAPIFIRLGNRGRRYAGSPLNPQPGSVKNIIISNVIGISDGPPESIISGIPGYPVENVKLDNITLFSAGNQLQHDFSIPIPENVKGYPRPNMFGKILPACGLYIRHVKGLDILNSEFYLLHEDARPAVLLDDVKKAFLSNIKVDTSPKTACLFRMINCQFITMENIDFSFQLPVIMIIEGKHSKSIRLDNKLGQFKRTQIKGNKSKKYFQFY